MSSQPQPQVLLSRLYTGNPVLQLERAQALACWLQEHNARAAPLVHLLPELQRAAGVLAEHMQRMQLGDICRACATRPGGGCCSASMAANSDVPLMVLNLLLGASIRTQEHSQDACCFLGSNGCLFVVKPIFCLNYYCRQLQERLLSTEQQVLDSAANQVLARQCAWEEQLLGLMRSQAIPMPN